MAQNQGDQMIWKKWPIFQKVAKKAKKSHNIYLKAHFESSKHLHQTSIETLKYLQQTMVWNCQFRWNCDSFA